MDLEQVNSVLIFLILVLVGLLLKWEMKMADDLTAITAAVANETTVNQSAITLLQSLSAQLATIKNDPVAIQALADSINKNATDLAAAVTANTPAVVPPSS